MIAEFNRQLQHKAILHLLGGLFFYALAWLFSVKVLPGLDKVKAVTKG